MPNIVTIWTFPYQHQLLIVRGRMEAEGIETFTQDELTIQVDPLYSNALGGIKLMVHEDDVVRATEILADSGFIKKEEKQVFEFLQVFFDATARLPLIGSLSFERRLLIIMPAAIILMAVVLYLIAK